MLMSNYTSDKLWAIIKQNLNRPHIDRDVYISCMLSLLNDRTIIYNCANEELVEIVMKEIMNKFLR